MRITKWFKLKYYLYCSLDEAIRCSISSSCCCCLCVFYSILLDIPYIYDKRNVSITENIYEQLYNSCSFTSTWRNNWSSFNKLDVIWYLETIINEWNNKNHWIIVWYLFILIRMKKKTNWSNKKSIDIITLCKMIQSENLNRETHKFVS